ncbi:hypothetical protein BDP55DRAFT_635311 [Colletotrichum godetiae]|uniref:Short chain dehydrogenase n=1 Tax=Colletotrichum godetiae TaxID=1209918 RepID=A0AAJ0AI22_9PEZI|nr:uncharacterized protein BDP55DRAFT_635311 [Colletotrichum godetiae]KAK1672106.1 hypothetical protein BDP55DRAFT_635311 [Colletotrichum godetiae]
MCAWLLVPPESHDAAFCRFFEPLETPRSIHSERPFYAMQEPNVWLITGTTSGIGAALVEQFAARGDKVIATGRNATTRLADKKSDTIIPFDLDVTSPLADIKSQVQEAVKTFGHIDFVINNAGYSLLSSIEEADEEFVQKMFDTNLFGAMKVVQAVLPHFRERKSGIFGFIGAGFGWSSFPFMAHYGMAKGALTMFVEGLQKETAHLGIKAVIFEPGGVNSGMNDKKEDEPQEKGPPPGFPSIADYQGFYGEAVGRIAIEVFPNLPSSVEKLPPVLWDVIKGQGLATGKAFPIRVPIGVDSVEVIRQKCQEQLHLCDEWEKAALSTARDGVTQVPNEFMMKKLSILNMTDS